MPPFIIQNSRHNHLARAKDDKKWPLLLATAKADAAYRRSAYATAERIAAKWQQ
jgi:hypothetical protein